MTILLAKCSAQQKKVTKIQQKRALKHFFPLFGAFLALKCKAKPNLASGFRITCPKGHMAPRRPLLAFTTPEFLDKS